MSELLIPTAERALIERLIQEQTAKLAELVATRVVELLRPMLAELLERDEGDGSPDAARS